MSKVFIGEKIKEMRTLANLNQTVVAQYLQVDQSLISKIEKGEREASTDIIKKLAAGEPLPEKNRDHQLSGDYAGCRECHITPDWLLIYEVDGDELILYLTRTGSHSDLF